jgi:hypothetical protein
MPASGTMDVQAFAPKVSEINGYKTEAWTLKGAQILNVLFEVKNEPFPSLMPVTFHPVIPAYAIINVTHYPESPVGPFSIAEVRVGCRAGVRPRGFTLKSYVSTPAAARELASRWGYPASVADVSMRTFHDRVVGRVKADGHTILEVEMLDRDFIGGNDIQYVSSMHLCRNKEDGKLVVVQLDPEWTFIKAERGRPNIVAFDGKAWNGDDKLVPTWPISACYTIADTTLSPIRYVSDPDKDAFKGTTQIAA